MAKGLTIDLHDIEKKFLYQYSQASLFKNYVRSFVQSAMTNIEAELFQLYAQRSLDVATGQQLISWAKYLGVNYIGLTDEQIRDQCYWNAAENFGTGSLAEAVSFFTKWFRANRVKIEELGGGNLKLTVIDGEQRDTSTIKNWPCFPPGVAQINEVVYSALGPVFAFDEDPDNNGSGYGIVSRIGTGDLSPPIYSYPPPTVTGSVIWIDYLLHIDILNVNLNFKVELSKGADLLSSLKSYFATQPSDEIAGGLISIVDRNGTEWEFMCKQAFSAQPTLVTKVDDVATSIVSIRCVVNNVNWIDLRVNGVSRPYGTLNGVSGIPAFSAYHGTTTDSTIFANQNTNGLVIQYNITERPGIGGRWSLKI